MDPSQTNPDAKARSGQSITKKDLVRTIAERVDLPQLRTRELVQRTFEALIDMLVEHQRLELRNFGVFEIRTREARMARNPRTGERVPVPAKRVVTFKPGKEMEARVRDLERRSAAPSGPTAPQPDAGPRPPAG